MNRRANGFWIYNGYSNARCISSFNTSFWPTIQTSFDDLRNQDQLNCKSTTDICGAEGSNTTCYNASVGNYHTTTCAMVSIGPPLILIMLILGAIGMIIKGSPQQQMQPQYPGY